MSYKVTFHTEKDKYGHTNDAKSGWVILRENGSFVHEQVFNNKDDADKKLDLLKAFGFANEKEN